MLEYLIQKRFNLYPIGSIRIDGKILKLGVEAAIRKGHLTLTMKLISMIITQTQEVRLLSIHRSILTSQF